MPEILDTLMRQAVKDAALGETVVWVETARTRPAIKKLISIAQERPWRSLIERASMVAGQEEIRFNPGGRLLVICANQTARFRGLSAPTVFVNGTLTEEQADDVALVVEPKSGAVVQLTPGYAVI